MERWEGVTARECEVRLVTTPVGPNGEINAARSCDSTVTTT